MNEIRMFLNKELERLDAPAGVYMITGILSNMRYIGSSSNMKNRFEQHHADLRNNNHINKNLQNDYNSGDWFLMEPIRFITYPTHADLYEAESKEILKALQSGEELYNIAIPSGVTSYVSDDTILREMANRYCKQRFNMSVNLLLHGRVPAYKQMMYDILMGYETEEEAHKKYDAAIEIQRKKRWYSGFGIDYDKCVIEAELNDITIKEAIKREAARQGKKIKRGTIEKITA